MADLVELEAIRRSFLQLTDDLAAAWPADDLAVIREDIGYGEYGEALENLIALAEKSDLHFDERQADSVFALVRAMEMSDSPWVAKLRQLT